MSIILLEAIEPVIDFLTPYIGLSWEIVKKWYWVALPFVLWKPAVFLWLWWRGEIWSSKQKNILLEIRIAKENPKPMRAMEMIFAGVWPIYSPPSPIELWWDGQDLQSYSFEIVAIDGTPHFFIRCPDSAQNMIESHIYSQFPEAEIFEVEDYTQKVPQDIPNKNWNIWGTDFKLLKPDPYPIKTYRDFETEREAKEEKRIDPIASLLEGMAKLKKGEQMWLQIIGKPIGEKEFPWKKKGQEIVDQLVHRGSPPKEKPFLQEIFQILIFGPQEKGEKSKETLPPEMKLTPGEKDTVSAIERKTSKLGYEVAIRCLYLGKKEAFFKPNVRVPISYFSNFTSENLNGIVPEGSTGTKVRKKWYDSFWFPKRRLYLKQRKILKKYIDRLPYPSPRPGGTFALNTEELATIYHFPSKILTPASLLPRVEAKKGEAPLGLPTEEQEEEE